MSIAGLNRMCYKEIMTNINTKLTKAEMKALAIVLSAGYASGRERPDDVRDIFINRFIHLTIG